MKNTQSLLLTGAGGLLVLAITLWPSGGEADLQSRFWCLFCGSRDVADSLLNLLLFLPLGAGLSAFQGPVMAVGGSLALSGFVELMQTTLPGRYASLEDLVSNTAGGLLGAVIIARSPQLLKAIVTPSRLIRMATLLLPLTVFCLSALLSRPRVSEQTLYGQWTHDLGRLKPYPGQVLSASIGELQIPDARVPEQNALTENLKAQKPIRVSVVAGPEPLELSHVFAIYDGRQQEVLLLAVQGPDLLFQEKTLSVGLLFDQPFLRWRGAIRGIEGDTVRLGVFRAGRKRCLQVDSAVNCGLAAGVEGGWRLIHRLKGAPSFVEGTLGVFWLFLLSFPAGLVGRTPGRRRLVEVACLGLGIGIAGASISWVTPWLTFHSTQLLAPMAGVWAGIGSHAILARRHRRVRGLQQSTTGP
ncbi:MAG: VanZ family protein [Gemmatimonadota bacterium]